MHTVLLLSWLAASIEGRLWNPITGVPIRKADVAVGAAGGAPVGRAVSDVNGRFVVKGLPAGSYRVAAGRAGFLPALFPGVIVLRADETRRDVNIPMETPAAIGGHVFDAEGEPVERVPVIALQRRGARVSQVANTETNDRGEYRLAGLPAGAYVVHAARAPAPSDDGTAQIYGPSFYPASDAFEAASPVNVAQGSEARDIDLHITRSKAAILQGTVQGAGNQLPRVTLARKSADAVMAALPAGEMTALPGGGFRFDNLAPGRYVVTARLEQPFLWALAEITIASGGTDTLDLTLEPGRVLEGEMNAGDRVILTRTDGMRREAKQDDGKLRFRDMVPGTWEVEVEGISPDSFIDSGEVIALDNGAWPTVRLSVSEEGGSVEGKGNAIRLTPENGSQPREALAGEDGRFRLRGIRPGKYRIACSGESIEIKARVVVKRDCLP